MLVPTLYLSRVRARRVNTLTLTVREEVNVWTRQYNGPNSQVLTQYIDNIYLSMYINNF